jgi:hypothetical protein
MMSATKKSPIQQAPRLTRGERIDMSAHLLLCSCLKANHASSACPPHIPRVSNHTLAFVYWRFRHLEFARRDAMATVPATPDLATMALRGQVIVKTKIFSLRSRVLA